MAARLFTIDCYYTSTSYHHKTVLSMGHLGNSGYDQGSGLGSFGAYLLHRKLNHFALLCNPNCGCSGQLSCPHAIKQMSQCKYVNGSPVRVSLRGDIVCSHNIHVGLFTWFVSSQTAGSHIEGLQKTVPNHYAKRGYTNVTCP